MKKFLQITAFVILISCLLGMTAFAKVAIDATGYFANIYKFVNAGEEPDLTPGYITYKFRDSTEETLTLDSTWIPKEIDFSTPGLVTLPLSKYGLRFDVDFVVIDPSADLTRFTDFDKNYWGYKKIRHVVMAGFFEGVSKTEFGVKNNMTRAQFCKMLYNIYKNHADVLKDGESVTFTDVLEKAWYYEAVSACAKAGIVKGVGDERFAPDDPIKREDAAIMMMRVLIGEEGIEQTDVEKALEKARKDGIAAGDFDKTHTYAKKAVAAALGVIYYGDGDGNITPTKFITRAECAAMMSNYFFKDYVEPQTEKYLIYLSPENRDNEYTGVDTTEHEQTLKVANFMKTQLEALGYEVFIADKSTSIREGDGNYRAKEAKEMGADAYIALHSNAVSGTNSGKYQGCICFYNGNNEGAESLSKAIYDNLAKLTPTTDGGSRNDMLEEKPFVEVRLPEMANVLIEIEYHDYAPYAKWITENTEAIAQAITGGIDKHFKSKE